MGGSSRLLTQVSIRANFCVGARRLSLTAGLTAERALRDDTRRHAPARARADGQRRYRGRRTGGHARVPGEQPRLAVDRFTREGS